MLEETTVKMLIEIASDMVQEISFPASLFHDGT